MSLCSKGSRRAARRPKPSRGHHEERAAFSARALRKLTAVEAALEGSLSVEEAERMLQELAAKGHLEVSIEHGKLHYALWVREAPL